MAGTKRGARTADEGPDAAVPLGGFRDVEPTQDPIQRRRAAVIRDPIPIEPRQVWLVALIAAACTALLWFRTDHLNTGSPYFSLPWDHHMYIFMAQHNPIDFHIAPYGWRILVPGVVWASHLKRSLGFSLVTLLSVWGTGIAVWALLRRLGFSRELAIAGMLLYFALGFATKWTLFDFWLTDPLAFLLATCAVLFALSGKDVGFAICLAVGVLAKESVIFVAPLAYTLRTRRVWDPALAAKTVAATLPAVAALVAVHIGIPAQNSDNAYVSQFHRPIQDNIIGKYTYGAQFHAIVSERLHHLGSTLIRAVSAFGLVVPILVGVGLRSRWARSFGLRALPFLVLVWAQLLFAYNTERLLVLGLIAVIPLATWGLEQLMEMRGVGPARYVALAAVVFAAQLIWKHEWEPALWVSFLIVAAGVLVAGPWRVRLPVRSDEDGEPAPALAAVATADASAAATTEFEPVPEPAPTHPPERLDAEPEPEPQPQPEPQPEQESELEEPVGSAAEPEPDDDDSDVPSLFDESSAPGSGEAEPAPATSGLANGSMEPATPEAGTTVPDEGEAGDTAKPATARSPGRGTTRSAFRRKSSSSGRSRGGRASSARSGRPKPDGPPPESDPST